MSRFKEDIIVFFPPLLVLRGCHVKKGLDLFYTELCVEIIEANTILIQ
jgi:hypothetical protein